MSALKLSITMINLWLNSELTLKLLYVTISKGNKSSDLLFSRDKPPNSSFTRCFIHCVANRCGAFIIRTYWFFLCLRRR